MNSVEYKPIGYIYSCFKEKFGTPRQAILSKGSYATIQLSDHVKPMECLVGLEGFSHIWLIYHFHLNQNTNYLAKIHPPRLEGKKLGVLSTRSPHRPNSIGLSLVQLLSVDKNKIYVSGVDLVDGTPILDIKPYIAQYDGVEQSKSGWLDEIKREILKVSFSEQALADLKRVKLLSDQGKIGWLPEEKELHTFIINILSEDPRNPMDKEDSRLGKRLGFFIYDLNVLFESLSEGEVKVLAIETRQEFEERL